MNAFSPTTDLSLTTPRGLEPTRAVLDNGVVALAKQITKTPAITINLTVRAGTVDDPPDSSGAMHLLARVIDRGSAHHSSVEIAEELDRRGISLTVSVRRHTFSLVCTCLAEDLQVVLELLGDVLMHPAIPPTELAARKREVLTRIRQDEDNPAVRSVETLMQSLYGGHPYGRAVKGTAAVVERITRDELLSLHSMRFAPSGLIAAIVGDVPEPQAVELVDRTLRDWRVCPGAAKDLPIAPTPLRRSRVVIPMMNKAQADIAYGFIAIARANPSYYSYVLMNNVLGQYALGGRLGDSIRERQGMAYYVFSSLDPDMAEGPLMIRAGVSGANVERAIASIDEELRRFRADGVTPQELTESRQFLIGSMPRALETSAGIAAFLQSAEFFGLGVDYDVQFPKHLHEVTLDALNSAAREALDPERATIVIAGPYQDERAD
jgi:zinc protease